METMKIGERFFPVAGYVTDEAMGTVPLVDLPMMSDYRWQLKSLRDRLEAPEKYRAIGEDVEVTIADLRRWLKEHSEGADR